MASGPAAHRGLGAADSDSESPAGMPLAVPSQPDSEWSRPPEGKRELASGVAVLACASEFGDSESLVHSSPYGTHVVYDTCIGTGLQVGATASPLPVAAAAADSDAC